MAKKLQIIATLPPLHPGEVLREEFLLPTKLSPYAVAKACGIPRTRIERIAREELGITADTALRLGRFFGIEPQFWLNLQNRYDLETANAAIGPALDRIPVIARARHEWLRVAAPGAQTITPPRSPPPRAASTP
jgi:addiction module HigA family antidote